jgi:predicted metal-dependent peptidase
MSLLIDPKGLAGADLEQLTEKMRVVQMIISRRPDKGGSPFIYAFSSTKRHIIEDISEVVWTNDEGTEEIKTYTAATDGKNYFWHPNKIKNYSAVALSITMMHETWHIVLQHCDPQRVQGKNRKVWNYAVDYVANSMIEHDFRQSNRFYAKDDYRNTEHPIWKGDVGKPLYFSDLLESLRKTKQRLAKEIKDLQNGKIPKIAKPKKPDVNEFRKFADYSLYGRSAESIYEEIMKEFDDMTDAAVNFVLQNSDHGGEDSPHFTIDIPRSSLLQQILDAVTASKKIAGSAPAGAEGQLAALSDPKLSWQDIVRVSFQQIRKEKGSINDWCRFRRRNLSLGLYTPKKKDQFIRWLAFLDTSGSMSPADMSYGVSQLKCLDGRSEGIVVPVDAIPYWDKMTRIHSMSDLPRINPTGRGGTVAAVAFQELEQKIREPIDMILYLTDGYIFDLDKLKKPKQDVLWVLTSDIDNFKPPFGRAASLRNF